MSSTGLSVESSTAVPHVGVCDMKLEVVTLPVADVDRAKRFYEDLGWRCDADVAVGDSFRAVQMTPPHSDCSIAFGKGLTTGEPGSVKRLMLASTTSTPRERTSADVAFEVSDVFHLDRRPCPGADPQAALLPELRVVLRSGRKRVAGPGDHDAASGPGMGGLRWTSRPSRLSFMKRRSITIPMRRVMPRTTGGTGTPRTSMLASMAAARSRHPRRPVATWRSAARCVCMSSSRRLACRK